MTGPRDWLTVAEFAKHWGYSASYAYDIIRAGRLRVHRVPSATGIRDRIYINPDDAERFIADRQ